MKLSKKKNKPAKETVRALVLFSGGLDSILAVKILEILGIDVSVLTFVSYFFDGAQGEKSARENKITLRVEDMALEHFCMIKKPEFGYGVGMNPCIDCHLLMLKTAKKIMQKEKYDFLATGEVLGQRPMSQNAAALRLIEKKAGLVGKILRPLSAGVLPETEMEKAGLVERQKLFGISGRSRKKQMQLAAELGIKYYPTPAGGCILTDKEYSKKLRELLKNIKNVKKSDIALLRTGRHFWLGKTRIILGRNHEENLQLKKIAEKGDMLAEPKNIPGPTALVRGKRNEEVLEHVKVLVERYTKKTEEGLSLKLAII